MICIDYLWELKINKNKYLNATIVNTPLSLVETNVPTKVVGTNTKRNIMFP